MMKDSRIYPEPEKFNPDRFLVGEGRIPQPDPREPAFGFGRRYKLLFTHIDISPSPKDPQCVLTLQRLTPFSRRICPGKDLAYNTVLVAMASLFHVFKITPSLARNGVPVDIPVEFGEHTMRCVWFEISSRSSQNSPYVFLRHPKPFKCIITPRLPTSVDLIRQTSLAA